MRKREKAAWRGGRLERDGNWGMPEGSYRLSIIALNGIINQSINLHAYIPANQKNPAAYQVCS